LVDAKKIVQNIIDSYGLSLSKNHIKNVIDEVKRLSLGENASHTVAKNLLDIGESYFFRDSHTWEAVDQLLSSIRNAKMLSLGCSEGEEVYTFSFLAKKWGNSYMLGIDASEERINVARAGLYEKWKLRKLKEKDIDLYFDKVGDKYAVKYVYRDNVHFIVDNILNFESKGKFDICISSLKISGLLGFVISRTITLFEVKR